MNNSTHPPDANVIVVDPGASIEAILCIMYDHPDKVIVFRQKPRKQRRPAKKPKSVL
jgi:hypothetical protein